MMFTTDYPPAKRMANYYHSYSRRISLYCGQGFRADFRSHDSRLHVWLPELKLVENIQVTGGVFIYSGEQVKPLKFVLQLQLLSLSQIGQANQIFHPVGAGGFKDRTPEKFVRRPKYFSNKYFSNKEILSSSLLIVTRTGELLFQSRPLNTPTDPLFL